MPCSAFKESSQGRKTRTRKTQRAGRFLEATWVSSGWGQPRGLEGAECQSGERTQHLSLHHHYEALVTCLAGARSFSQRQLCWDDGFCWTSVQPHCHEGIKMFWAELVWSLGGQLSRVGKSTSSGFELRLHPALPVVWHWQDTPPLLELVCL